jgi:signal peptidase I
MTTTVWRTAGPVTGRRAHGSPKGSGTVRGFGPLRDGGVFVLVVAGRFYRTLLLTLVAIAILPAVGSWTSYLVRTGSMEPSISAGDVVVGQPFGGDEKVPVGRVMVFEAPPGSGAGPVLRVHRVVEHRDLGGYVTAGDANPTPDAAYVPRDNFRSRAVIDVPYIGLPLVWLDNRQYLRLALWLLASMLLLSAAFRRLPDDPPYDSGWWRRALNRLGERLGLRSRHRRTGPVLRVVLALTSAVLITAVPTAASAAFTATTRSGSNTWKAATVLRQAYTTAVMADAPYAFYRLDEASGASSTDYAGNNRTGTYTSVATYRQPGALPKNPGYAIGLAANSGRMVGGGTGLYNPTTFTVEMWFKTTTTTGGKLIGFENARDGSSAFYDRELFMVSDGRVVYMGGISTTALVNSPAPLNNGAWHHVVVTSRPTTFQQDTSLYVDGVLVDTGATNKASALYTGWWRVGFGKLPLLGGMPPSANFTGSVDDVAIYTTQLSATRIAAHYAAR